MVVRGGGCGVTSKNRSAFQAAGTYVNIGNLLESSMSIRTVCGRLRLRWWAIVLAAPGLALSQPGVTSVEVSRFAVTSGHPAATAAGLSILEAGGNVVDAAVATSLSLGVAAPYGSGLGGKFVMLYREGATGKVTCVEALAAAPRDLDPRAFARLPLSNSGMATRPSACPGCRPACGPFTLAGVPCPGAIW